MGIIFGSLAFLLPAIVVSILIFFIRNKSEDKNNLTNREFFTELAIFYTLITSIICFISVLFMAIDKKFQDITTIDPYAYSSVNSDLASIVSVLIVVFPIYLFFAWLKSLYLKKNQERRNVNGFKYSIYITMIATVLFIASSLVATIYNFLMGELTLIFGYKVLIVAIVSILLFAYSYFSLKRDFSQKSYVPILSTIFALVLVFGGIVYSILILGTPSEMRKRKLDDIRLSNLSEIQSGILNYWQQEYKLPSSLKDIKGDGLNYKILSVKDPKTKKEYIYQVLQDSKLEAKSGQDCRNFYPNRFSSVANTETIKCEIPTSPVFKICAEFETVRTYDENGLDQSRFGFYPSNSASYELNYYNSGADRNPSWNHDLGEFCFERTIDPKKYTSFK